MDERPRGASPWRRPKADVRFPPSEPEKNVHRWVDVFLFLMKVGDIQFTLDANFCVKVFVK